MKTIINLCLNDLISHHCPMLLKINPNIAYYIHWGKNDRRTLSGRQKSGRGRLIEVAASVKRVLFTVLY